VRCGTDPDSVPAARSTASSGRLTSLDGLRGLAALVVMVHHVVLAGVPILAAAYVAGSHGALPGWADLLVHSPLHLLWAGEEFVLVFFALSGFVLTMPTVRGGALSPARYYPHRLLRLYGPVWAAILFAVVVRSLVPHEAVPGASWWLNAHQEAVSPWQLQHDGTLVFGTGGFAATSVLWSLRWEVLFSLFLPVFLLIGKRTRGMPWAVAGVAFAVLALSGGHDSPRYMPAFLLGSLMAFEIDRLRALGARLAAPTVANRTVKALLVAVCIVSMTAVWWVRPDSPAVEHGLRAVVAAGACIAVGLPLLLGSLRSFLDTPVMQWAGSRSFSLYLVHEPIVVAAAFALGGTMSVALLAAVAMPVALLAAEGFFRVAERPVHRWSRALGLWVEARVSALSAASRRSRVPDSA
jgi:peptidoglycan/LPS O-acetylase OafA/YrhL